MPLSVKCVVIVCVFVAQLVRASYVTINSYRLDPETDPSVYKTGTLRVTKKSRNLVVVSGTWELLQNMGEDVECVHSVFRKSELSGQYKKFMESKQAFCEYFNKDMIFLPKIREVSNLPEPGICPLPKGNYTVENYTYELQEALPMPPGDYLLIARFIKNGNQLLIGLEWSITVHQ
ncbi:AAEL006504-PA [Aedes aegypti]|uniref:AAEL006504-PA n=1 Tax=Aedes aegypti TaxID=7159 RepID=Q175Z0_AEDAE|nr:AAEL006504-PA [Aedes aegypti]